MRKDSTYVEGYRISGPPGEMVGAFKIQGKRRVLRVIAGNGLGWDHVSVSTEARVPKWQEMCFVKDLFFEEEEVVMQLHPRRSQYINHHPNCLHLWRPQTAEEMALIKLQWGDEWMPCVAPGPIPEPPSITVGPKAQT